MHDIQLAFLNGVAEVLREQMLHHFRHDLVSITRLHHLNGGFAGPEARYPGASRKFLSDMKDFVVDNILGNFDVEILLGRADVDQFCFHILLSRLAMRKEGLEPSRCYPLDPKSSACANSATRSEERRV